MVGFSLGFLEVINEKIRPWEPTLKVSKPIQSSGVLLGKVPLTYLLPQKETQKTTHPQGPASPLLAQESFLEPSAEGVLRNELSFIKGSVKNWGASAVAKTLELIPHVTSWSEPQTNYHSCHISNGWPFKAFFF